MTRLKSIIAAASLAALAAGCTTNIDDDAYRAGAITLELNEVTTDELYPTAGDEIDWKMVFVPTPGDITVNVFWDHPLEIFDVEVGVYDRFGIPIKKEARESGGARSIVKTFLPESGLHFVKLSGASGRSIYSINIGFETNYDGFEAPESAPSFDAYLDFDAEVAAKKEGDASNSGKNAGKGGGASAAPAAAPAAALPAAAGGGMALPAAAAGGVALPSAAAGGMMDAGGSEGPTVVRSGGGGASWSNADVKKLDTNAGATNSNAEIKPICSDIRGKYFTIEAEVMAVSSLSKGTQFKLDAGRKQGVKDGSVGEIYIDGEKLEGGRFKIEKILDTSSTCVTNAPSKLVKKASKFVIKVPE